MSLRVQPQHCLIYGPSLVPYSVYGRSLFTLNGKGSLGSKRQCFQTRVGALKIYIAHLHASTFHLAWNSDPHIALLFFITCHYKRYHFKDVTVGSSTFLIFVLSVVILVYVCGYIHARVCVWRAVWGILGMELRVSFSTSALLYLCNQWVRSLGLQIRMSLGLER